MAFYCYLTCCYWTAIEINKKEEENNIVNNSVEFDTHYALIKLGYHLRRSKVFLSSKLHSAWII